MHFLSGLTALSFPYLIQSPWLVLLLALGFSGLIFLAKKRGILKSINDVNRKSHGALFFPVAVYVIFLLSHDQPVLYFVSILIMTVSDSLAALIGEVYGHISYEVEESTKSLEGSVIFFLTTFLCVHLSLLFMTPLDKLNTVLDGGSHSYSRYRLRGDFVQGQRQPVHSLWHLLSPQYNDQPAFFPDFQGPLDAPGHDRRSRFPWRTRHDS